MHPTEHPMKLGIRAVCIALGMLIAACSSTGSAINPVANQVNSSRPSVESWHARNADRYKREWGVDIVGVRPVSSGQMLRFAYRVLDPVKAAPLFDQRVKPYLYDTATGARMAVPAMENIGELRQTPKPVADRTYFVIFGNPGRFIKPGGQVRIVIGQFEVSDLVVD